MESSGKNTFIGIQKNKVVHYALQLSALSVLIFLCFKIIQPFFTLLVWGIVLAITLYPLHKRLTGRFKGRKWLSASLITFVMLLFIIVPMVMLLLATIDEFRIIKDAYLEGQLQIPPPNEEVKNWPVIGSALFNYWTEASISISDLIKKHYDVIKPIIVKLIDLVSSAGKGVLFLMLSFIVGGAILVYGESGSEMAKSLFIKLAGKQGEAMQESVALTVRNVAKGVLGVSFIQSILAGIGIILAGVPLAGLWILICLVLAIVQIGILPVSLGVIIYVWGSASTTTAILITVWMLFVGIVDNIIKPYMLGKGAPAPMLIVFIGSIGGFIVNGFIGLFTGAILLTLGYNLFIGWLQSKE